LLAAEMDRYNFCTKINTELKLWLLEGWNQAKERCTLMIGYWNKLIFLIIWDTICR
jgi:hypothetical protein